MKTIQTKNFIKLSKYYDRGPSVDDQPNLIPRDDKGEGWCIFVEDSLPDSEDEIKKRWKRRKRRNVNTEAIPKGSL